MTKEVIKLYFPYLKALADDKEVQCDISGEWKDIEEISFSIGVEHYRIKPKSKYRPFKNQEECWQEMLKHQPFGWIRNNITQYFFNINHFGYNHYSYNHCGVVIDNSLVYFDLAFSEYNFVDDTPFGIREEE